MIPGAGRLPGERPNRYPADSWASRSARITTAYGGDCALLRGLVSLFEGSTLNDPRPISAGTSAIDIARLVGGTEPIIVRSGDALQQLAGRAVRNPACRVLSVIDDEERLAGVISVGELLDDVFLKVVPEESLGAIEDVPGALRYAQHIGARTAADIMAPPVWVEADDTLRTIFHRLHQSGLNGLPVTDADRRVIAYVDQLELVMSWIQSTGREVLLQPEDDSPA
jgi:CBS domain-containing protein